MSKCAMDGSKCEEGVGATVMLRRNKIVASLPHVATVFTAEVVGLKWLQNLLKDILVLKSF